MKTAQDCGGRIVTAATRTFDPDPEAEALLLSFLSQSIPGASTGAALTKTCLYTLTPDRDFVLDAVPGHPDVVVGLGAAHGFKFAALFGEILRDLALGRRPGARPRAVPHRPPHPDDPEPRPHLARLIFRPRFGVTCRCWGAGSSRRNRSGTEETPGHMGPGVSHPE